MTCSPPWPSRLGVSNTCSSVSRPRRVTGERDITDRYRQLHQVARPVTSAVPTAAPGSPTAGLDVLSGQVGDAAGWGEAVECGVSPVMVVGVEPGVKGLAAAG